MRILYVILLLIQWAYLPSQVADRRYLEQERNAIISRIDQQERLLEETRVQEKTALNQYVTLQQQVADRRTLIENLVADSVLIESQIDSLTQVREQLSRTTLQDQATYRSLLKASYVKKLTGIRWLDYLSNQSLNTTIRKYWYESQLVNRLQSIKGEISEQGRVLDAAILELESLKTSKGILTNQAKQMVASLKQDIVALEELRSRLTAQEDALRQRIDMEQQRRTELNAAIEQVVLQNMTAGNSERTSIGGTSSATPSSIQKPSPDASVVATFGQQAHPSLQGVQINRTGVSLRSSSTDAVLCVYDGTVASVSNQGDIYTIIVKHGEYYSVYSQLSTCTVQQGDTLLGGQQIGSAKYEGSAWSFDFEWWKGKRAIDPEKWW